MANNVMFNPDGSYSYGKGKPLSQGLKIDPSRIQAREIPNGASPWTKSANAKVGGSYPTTFMNDGVRSQMGNGFNIVPEGSRVPSVIERPITVESMPKSSGNLPPSRMSPYIEPSFKNGNGSGLQDAKTMGVQALIASLIPSVTQASELESSGIANDMAKNGYNPGNKKLDYSQNPARDMANMSMNFDDPIVANLFNKPQPQTIAQVENKPTIQQQANDNGLDMPNYSASYKQTGRINNGNQAQMVSHESDLDSMIKNYANQGQNMGASRDEELMRLMGMRNQVEGAIANKSTFDRMDLSPLSRFVDSMYGSKMSDGYEAPDSGIDDLNNVNSVNDKIANYTKNKNAEQLGLYKTIMDSQYKNDMLDLRAEIANNKADPLATWLLKEQYKKQNSLEKAPNGDQSKAATFATRMSQAEIDLANASQNYDRSNLKNSVLAKIMPEAYRPEGQKLIDQAEKNFINAQLRRESGAAISPTEFSNAESQYFERVNDPSEVKLQKKRNREMVIAGMQAEAGNVALDRVNQRLQTPTTVSNKTPPKLDMNAIEAELARRMNK